MSVNPSAESAEIAFASPSHTLTHQRGARRQTSGRRRIDQERACGPQACYRQNRRRRSRKNIPAQRIRHIAVRRAHSVHAERADKLFKRVKAAVRLVVVGQAVISDNHLG